MRGIEAILALDMNLTDARRRMVSEFEQRYIERLLAAHDGNVTYAAAAAGITRRQLQRLRGKLSELETD